MPKWEITCECDKEDEVLDLILKNRGIKDQETFFNPPPISYWVKNLSSDFKSNLKKSKEIVEKAISDSRPIIIYGDYDVDGICATAILFTTIKNELGYDKVYYFIPNRFRHGYGLSKEGIHECEKPNALFITVDSGITNIEEAEYLKKLNHQVVITDHHQQKSKLPEADCILWDDQIVGATVAWLLSKALGSKNSTNIALCGLATVTDLQPIIGFNRTLVKESLKILNNNLPAGFCKLLSNGTNEITSYELGWVLGPRLNASGRLGDASMSLNLLIESDIKKAEKIADSLNEINKQRQDKTLEMYELAATVFDDDPPTIIISGHDDYHEGIIGLVAAKLKQRFHRPSIVITTSGDVAKGSARSISGVNIIELLRNYESLFMSLGGHPMAAGFSIKKESISKLKEELSKVKVKEEILQEILIIDAKVSCKFITLKTLASLEKLRPYGVGNRMPVFATLGLGVTSVNRVGKEKQHLSLRIFDGSVFHKAIYFNYPENYPYITIGDKVDLAYTLKANKFNGKIYLDLTVKDLRLSKRV